MTIRSLALAFALALVAAFALAMVVRAATLEAPLNPNGTYTAAHGIARYESDDQSGLRKLRVDLDDAWALKSTRLSVYVNGLFVGQLRVNGQGEANLRLRSDRQFVPVVGAGSPVEVRTASGSPVVAGTF